MGIISTIKELLGLDSSDRPVPDDDVEVTVEREPDAESERIVKESYETVLERGANESAVESEASLDDQRGESTEEHPEEESPEESLEMAETASGGDEVTFEPPDEAAGPSADEAAVSSADETTVESTADTEGDDELPETEDESPETEDETADTLVDEDEPEETPDGKPLQSIKGIGDVYAERLEDAGIPDTSALADADAPSLADESGMSETRLERWIERANGE